MRTWDHPLRPARRHEPCSSLLRFPSVLRRHQNITRLLAKPLPAHIHIVGVGASAGDGVLGLLLDMHMPHQGPCMLQHAARRPLGTLVRTARTHKW